jgi:hypothetical protein
MTHSIIRFSQIVFLLFSISQIAHSQEVMNKWQFNVSGQKATYYAQTGTAQTPAYTFTTSPDLADVLKICYTTDQVYVSSNGLTTNMGQYKNPGTCLSQKYIHRFPRNPTVPTTKTISPKGGAIGLLLNGIPIFGLGAGRSWSGTANTNPPNGKGIWNVEVYKSESIALDTAFGAHPQQQGAYHSHTTPYRLYKSTPTTQHSPIIGFAFDGNPVYGPYGYSDANNASSTITRMKSGYSLRNITTRTTLPYNVTASQSGPPVNSTYPIGTYCEDYEWLASNNGTLDKYNGRFCKTPEYPNGTYAYFVTISATGVPQFPYMIGIEYYGAPDSGSLSTSPNGNGLTIPSSVTTCATSTVTSIADFEKMQGNFDLFPNPSNGEITIRSEESDFDQVEIFNTMGQSIYKNKITPYEPLHLQLTENAGIYMVRCSNKISGVFLVKKMILE